MKNFIIAIEGIDGSGKGTQAKLLEEYYKNIGYDVKLISFPRYSETFFGKEVGNYLNGSFGSLNQVSPKLAAMLYAGDRYETKDMILDFLKKGYILIFDRYVSSNAAHQAARMPETERALFIEWIYNLEYLVYRLPEPDIQIYLNIPFSLSKKMVAQKSTRNYTENTHDIHEENENYLKKVSEMYDFISKNKNWLKIDCFKKNDFRNKQDILDDIINKINMELLLTI